MENFIFLALPVFFIFSLVHISSASVVSTGNFNKDFFVSWSPDHVNTSADGQERSLKLDQESGQLFWFFLPSSESISNISSLNFLYNSGSGFASSDMFLFGQIDMPIKLLSGYSAGTVVAFYVSNNKLSLLHTELCYINTAILYIETRKNVCVIAAYI